MALILAYHRVADVISDPWGLSVTPGRFARQLEIVRAEAHPMKLDELLAALRNGTAPHRAVAITFDDGYADNLYSAKPMLERWGIPAIVFVATGYVESGREFWWDVLERLLLHPGTLPSRLALHIDGTSYRWELGEAVRLDQVACQRYRDWRAWQDPPTSRHALYLSVWERLRPLAEVERLRLIAELTAWANSEAMFIADTDGTPPARPVSTQEFDSLAQGGLIEIGAHTVTHPLLTALPSDQQRAEIESSKVSVEQMLGRPVTSFAYPYGAYGEETVALVRAVGFTSACASQAGVLDRNSNCFVLPRVQVPDLDAEEYARWLSTWFRD
jgi:peptidoglycan/xylan/chitin deacetylase (PgdA/CDA1 family)